MAKRALFCLFLGAVMAAGLLTGCARHPQETEPVPETEVQATMITETVSVIPTETTAASPAVLTEWPDEEKIYLRLQPTGMVSAGDEFRCYTPEDQETWLAACETAAAAVDPEGCWQSGDRSTGISLRYQDAGWFLLESGDIQISSGRIPGDACQELRALIEEAADQLDLEPPVRPEEIHDLCRATLEFNGSHVLTDPEKLDSLEAMLSRSKELRGGAQCWFTAPLTLEREDGEILTLSMATDSCGTWLSQGVFYQYAYGGNEEFYALFDVDMDG